MVFKQELDNFFVDCNYDIRINKNARWIDQKCTCDVLSIIADCILEYTQYNDEICFTIKDIWESSYALENVEAIFSKPRVNSKLATNEYDKFFSQPINLFAYSQILIFVGKKSNSNLFKINRLDILEFIAMRETNALYFLTSYIKKVLLDSDLWHIFDNFFSLQNKQNFDSLKHFFTQFTIQHTKINGKTECGRIFTKIINPLAFINKSKGTRRGNISSTNITFDELRYNRINWRDELNGKDKQLTRKEYEKYFVQAKASANYNIQKAKKIVRKYNERYNDGLSEVRQLEEQHVKATQIHHIFPAAQYPTISDFVENLIALTPNQHYFMAHPNNQTTVIDKDFQYICLIAKTETIKNDLTQTYSFNDYKFVLNVGLHTDDFNYISDLDYAELLKKIDSFFSCF